MSGPGENLPTDLPQHARERLVEMRERKLFTSDLSVSEFVLVREAGFDPVGMVMGSCVYHVAHRGFLQTMRQAGQNVELENFTQALYDARELAMERMQTEAETLKAEGIVGVQLQEHNHGWDSHVIEFFAVGTAIIPTRADHEIATPQMMISLNDPSQ